MGRNTTMLDLTVKVTNEEEDGEATLEYQQPLIGRALTASVTDPDGGFNPANGAPRTGVTGVTWQWARTNEKYEPDTTECLEEATDEEDWSVILGAKMATYTPTKDDDRGCLRVTAKYIDRTFEYPHAPFADYDHDPATDWGFEETVQVISGVTRVDPVNKAPEFAGDMMRFVPENTPGYRYVDDPVTAKDTDPLVYSLGGDDETLFYIAGNEVTEDDDDTTSRNEIADAGQIRVEGLTELDHEGDRSYSVEVTATDTYDATDTTGVIINVVDVDEAPVIEVIAAPVFPAETAERSVEENTVAGANIGAAVAATDANADDTLTYTLGGDNATSFAIEPTTGQLMTKAALDFETKASYTVTVTASDGTDSDSDTITVTITVNNVDELGMVSGKATADYAENGTGAVATYTADGPASATWTLSGDDAGDFNISNGGELTFNASPNYEAAADADTDNVYQVTVEAEAGGEMGMVAVTVTVTNVDELGVVSGKATAGYAENGTGAVATYTADGPASATWTLSGDDAGDFTISGGGELTFAASPNYEAAADADTDNVYQVTVEAEAGGEMGMVAVTVTVTNVDELGMVSGKATAGYAENGTGAVATYTADGPASATWTLSGDDAGDFNISNGGELTFAASPNYEAAADADTDNVYQVTVEAEAGGEMGMVAVTVTVTNEDELGMVSGEATADYMENGTGAVASYTADGPASATWTLSGDDAGDFTISEGGELNFAASPNYEAAADADTDNVYQVTVEAEAGGEMGMVAVTVTVTDENEAPEFPSETADRSVPENTEAGEDIGAPVAATDADAGDTLTYALNGADAGSFDIGASTGQLMTKAALDFETKDSYTVTVTATDGDNASDSINVTVTVTDENEAPEFPSETADRSVPENTEAGEDIGAPVAATDADAGDTLTYTLGGVDMASFDIDASTGQLMTKAALDFETKASYAVTVTATDGDNASDSIDVTITVTDVDENLPPEFPSITADRSVPENTAPGVNIGGPVGATDPDEDELTYSLEGPDEDSFSIDPATGQLRTSAPLDRVTKSTYTVIVKATDEGGLSATITVTITVIDVANQAPVFQFPTAQRNIAEDTAAGENIGEPLAATDGDDDTLTYTLGGADMADFEIDPATGQLSTKTALDYETKQTYTVTVTAEDGNSGRDEVVVTITVANVDEEGTVTLSMDEPQVGAEITASLTDPDGGVTGETWQWASSAAMDGAYAVIEGATSASYTPVAGDENMYLRATASYDDGEGSGKSAMAVSGSAVAAELPGDTNNDGMIDKAEVIAAIDAYLFGEGADAITKEQVIEVINLYLFGS